MWPLLVCSSMFASCIRATDPPSTDTITCKKSSFYDNFPCSGNFKVTTDQLLLRLQVPIRQCYMQYEAAAAHIAQFRPHLLSPKFNKFPYEKCICEQWLPQEKPTQLYLTEGNREECQDNGRSEICDSFEPESCLLKFFMGDPNENPKPDVYKTKAILKCTESSSPDPKDQPKFYVSIDKMDDFDIGRRCKAQAVVNILKYRMELYRVGSEYFWQIPIFSRDIFMDNNVCDPMVFQSKIVMRIYYHCSATQPDLSDPTRHQKPLARPIALPLPSDLTPCYTQVGEPWSGILQQNFLYPPTMEKKTCACEYETGVLDAVDHTMNKDSETDCPFRRRFECDNVGQDDPCVNNIRINYNGSIDFLCTPDNSGEKINGPKNFGTEYFPTHVAMVDDVYFGHPRTVLNTISDFKPYKHLEYCPHPDDPEWQGGEYTTDEQYKLLKRSWTDWINVKTQYERPNSNIHLRVIFDLGKFVQLWCPNLLDDEFRKEKFKGGTDLDDFYLSVNIVCIPQHPIDI